MSIECPIWKTEAKELPQSTNGIDAIFIDSQRAGGKYSLTGTAVALLPDLKDDQKAKITTWIVDQHQLGIEIPTIDSYNMRQIARAAALSVEVRRDRLLRYVAYKCPRLGDVIKISGVVSNVELETFRYETMAWTESSTENETSTLIQYAKFGKYLEDEPNVRLTFNGHIHLEVTSKVIRDSTQAFIAMWFSDEMKEAYTKGFEPAVRTMGYQPLRIDQKEHNNKIDDEIIAEIRRSRFIIADFTCGIVKDGKTEITVPRGGVYYEAGFAQGLGIPVIWTCREDQISGVHFDTRQFNHVTWKSADELFQKLCNRIGAVIGDGPNKPN